MHYYLYTALPFPKSAQTTLRPISALNKETELFPIPKADCFPVLPENLILSFCQNRKKRPAFLVQSADYRLWNHSPRFISEQEALLLAQAHHAKLYWDPVSASSYFCYQTDCPHMVWLEDGFHLHQKMKFLQKNGVDEIAFPVSETNIQTLITLIQSSK